MKRSNLLLLLFTIIGFPASAQKLPKMQEGSVWAPDNIKIDGKLNEWNDQLQAYNIANYAYYTVSNNDNYLYLTVRMKGGLGSRKVFRGGLSFIISPTSANADDISITYPAKYYYNKLSDMPTWDSPVGLLTSTPSPERYKRLYDDTVANKKEIDDLVSSSNKTVKDTYKDIHVVGIKDIDELISIYNEQGIKLSGVFNHEMEYTYELAIPLKYVGDAINKGSKFKYTIALNFGGTLFRKTDPPGRSRVIIPAGASTPEMDYFNNTTSFSGEYRLAKKK